MLLKYRQFYRSVFALGLVVFMHGPAFAQVENNLYEQCYLSTVKKNKIGYACVAQKERFEGDKKLIVTEKHSEQKFKRFSFNVKSTQDYVYIEDELGYPVSMNAKIQSVGENVNIQADFSPEKIVVKSVVNGVEQTREIELKEKVLFPYAIHKLFVENSGEQEINYFTIDAGSELRVIKATYELQGKEQLNAELIDGEYEKYKVTIDLLPNIGNFEWYDSKGRMVKEYSSVLNIEQVAASKELVFEKYQGADLYYQSLVPVDATLEKPELIDQMTYKISLNTNSGKVEDLFAFDDRQRLIQVNGNIAYLKIKTELPSVKKYSFPINTKGMDRYLESGHYINLENDQIKSTVLKLIKDEDDAYKSVKNLEKWVYENIEAKDFTVNFANASKIFASKRGDCTERSILLASLLRSAKIPARVVAGLGYRTQPRTSFGYHTWVQAYIGKWVNLDPSNPSENFSPINIAFAKGVFSDYEDNNNQLVIELVQKFADLKLTILNYNMLNANLTAVAMPKKNNDVSNQQFNLIKFIKNNDSFVKKISLGEDKLSASLTEYNIKKESLDELVRAGYYNFSTADVKSSYESFKKASKLIPFNDDYADVNFAIKAASIGFFSIANSKLENIYDGDIWDAHVASLKKLYYPRIVPVKENEFLLAKALSYVKFKGEPEKAIELINNLEVDSDYSNFILSMAYQSKNDYKKSLETIKKALSVNSQNPVYKLQKAEVLTSLQKFKEAKKEIAEILNQNISDAEFLDYIRTQQNYINYKSSKKKNLKYYYLAKVHYSKGEYQQAYDILAKLKEENANYNAIYSLLGDIQYMNGNDFDALKNYKIALKLNKKNKDAYVGLGNIAIAAFKYDEALAQYQKALGIDDKSSDVLLKIADVYKLMAKNDKALEYYKEASKMDVSNYWANYNIAKIYYRMGDFDCAIEFYKKTLSSNSMHIQSWIDLANIYIKRNNSLLARIYLTPVKYIDDNDADYYYSLGLINKNNENNSSAIRNFKKALEINPDFQEAKSELESLKN